jgi:hypothetical protein
LGGRGQAHTRVEEDENGDSVTVNITKEETSDEENSIAFEEMGDIFHVPRLNKTQEKAASTFLNSKSNTITIIQG